MTTTIINNISIIHSDEVIFAYGQFALDFIATEREAIRRLSV